MLLCEKAVEKSTMTRSHTLNSLEVRPSQFDWRDHTENCFYLGLYAFWCVLSPQHTALLLENIKHGFLVN